MAIPVGSNAGVPPAAAPQPGGGDFQEVNDFQEVPGAPQPAAQAPPIPQSAGPAQPPLAGPRPGETFQVVTTAPELGSQSTMERLDGVERTLEEAIRRIDTIDKFTEAVRNDINQVKESISHMEANMRELTSLYDLISSQVNPFIDMETAAKAAGAAEEAAKEEVPEFDALFEPTPEIAAEGEAAEAVLAEGEAIPAPFEVVGEEGGPVAAVEAAVKRIARLSKVGDSPTCQMAFVHWINFMLDSVPRRELPNLLSFYIKIGWISTGIKQEVIDFVRGVSGEELEEDDKAKKARAKAAGKPKDKDGDVVMTYDKEELHELARTEVKKGGKEGVHYDSWKMSAEDHLKSLILIERIRGAELDKDALEALERDVAMLKEGLDDFFAL